MVVSYRKTKLTTFLTKRHKTTIKSLSQRNKFTKTLNELVSNESMNVSLIIYKFRSRVRTTVEIIYKPV